MVIVVSYLLICGLGLVFASEWFQVVLEEMVQFLRKSSELSVIRVLDHRSSHNCFEELTLQHNSNGNALQNESSNYLLVVGMNVVRLNSELLVKFLWVFILLFFFAGRVSKLICEFCGL